MEGLKLARQCISCYIKQYQDNKEFLIAWRNKSRKQCRKCKKEYIVNEKYFKPEIGKLFGVSDSCKRCSNDVAKVARHTRRARVKLTEVNYKRMYWYMAIKHFGGVCAYCGVKVERLHQDHVIPVAKGGGYIKSNIIPVCGRCNTSKNSADMETWYKSKPYFDEERYKRIRLWILNN
jgi:bacterioferritin-associated ferredoxin